ncbi:hypothetical protein P12x_005389 [Tundrisphaera lichenicola]|uniref:hypothetical protein n=1 Tax=Tundrisphaera lichenicola TaxID=2029860 RepID=UPI003EBB7F35
MRRFSILSLMGLVLAVAISFAALRGANDWWAGGLVLATLGLLGYGILAAWHGRGRSRAAWLGFLVFAGGYFFAIRTLPDPEASWLPTSQALQIFQDRWFGASFFTISLATTTTTPGGPGTSNFVVSTVPSGNSATSTTISANTVAIRNPVTVGSSTGLNAQFYNGLWPLVPNRAAFTNVGHSLFALLAGWFGAFLSRWMWARREARDRIEAVSIAPDTQPA